MNAFSIIRMQVKPEYEAEFLALADNPGHGVEIVLTQMTKAPALTVGTERDDIADLDLVFGDHDAVDQQFDKLAPLVEVGLGQPALHPLAELGR